MKIEDLAIKAEHLTQITRAEGLGTEASLVEVAIATGTRITKKALISHIEASIDSIKRVKLSHAANGEVPNLVLIKANTVKKEGSAEALDEAEVVIFKIVEVVEETEEVSETITVEHLTKIEIRNRQTISGIQATTLIPTPIMEPRQIQSLQMKTLQIGVHQLTIRQIKFLLHHGEHS